jgi:hypothetical protein
MGDRTSMRYRYEYRYGIWDIDFGYGISIWYLTYRHGHLAYRYGIWANDMGHDSIDTVITHIGMEYGLMIWEMTVSIRSSLTSIWDILSLCLLRSSGGGGKWRSGFA